MDISNGRNRSRGSPATANPECSGRTATREALIRLGRLDAGRERLNRLGGRPAAATNVGGEALRRNGRRSAARSVIEVAHALFMKVGATRWADRADAELHSVSGRARRHGLTPAEHRVAEVVAVGKTNKEVATTLFLADRTVEGHLTHIYAELGLRSRSELARRFRSN